MVGSFWGHFGRVWGFGFVFLQDTKSGRTALLRAVETNSLQMAELLLRVGRGQNGGGGGGVLG